MRSSSVKVCNEVGVALEFIFVELNVRDCLTSVAGIAVVLGRIHPAMRLAAIRCMYATVMSLHEKGA